MLISSSAFLFLDSTTVALRDSQLQIILYKLSIYPSLGFGAVI